MLSAIGFAQTPSEKIQTYISENKEKLNLSSSEINQWIIESETSSETMGLIS